MVEVAKLVKPQRTVPLSCAHALTEIVEAAINGTVTAFAAVACENGYAHWEVRTPATRRDIISLIGQLEAMKHRLICDLRELDG